ncbi:MAG: hypothetical protein E7B94_20640, partial [Enterobacter sp.]|nr:hypothetical protein [Enterobacter sp.]
MTQGFWVVRLSNTDHSVNNSLKLSLIFMIRDQTIYSEITKHLERRNAAVSQLLVRHLAIRPGPRA